MQICYSRIKLQWLVKETSAGMCDLILCPSEENAAYFKFYLMLNFMCRLQLESKELITAMHACEKTIFNYVPKYEK